MPAINDSTPASRGAYTAIQPRPEVRLSRLQKIARFLGFSRIRALYDTTPKLPAVPYNPGSDREKSLSGRHIAMTEPTQTVRPDTATSKPVINDQGPADIWSDINRQYLGYRASSGNLNRLYHDILKSKIACQPNENHEQYRNRVTLTFIACGLADSHNGKVRGLRSLNRPLSKNQLTQLEESLNKPLHEVVREVTSGQSKAQRLLDREIDRYPRLLMEVCTRMPLEKAEDLLFVSRHCHHYLISGEGQDVLKKQGFPDAVEGRMKEILPVLQPGRISTGVMKQVKKYQESFLKADGTDNAGRKINGINYAPEKSEQSLNPESPEQRCLLMLQTLATGWLGYCEGRVQAALAGQDNEDDNTAAELAEAKRSLNNNWVAMSHRIMLNGKEFSTNFDSKNYQQVVLRRSDDQVVCWNSDNVQPRGGWFDNRRSDPVSLPE